MKVQPVLVVIVTLIWFSSQLVLAFGHNVTNQHHSAIEHGSSTVSKIEQHLVQQQHLFAVKGTHSHLQRYNDPLDPAGLLECDINCPADFVRSSTQFSMIKNQLSDDYSAHANIGVYKLPTPPPISFL